MVVANICDEVGVFLNCLGDHDARERFLECVPSSILEKGEAISLCETFNGLEPGTLAHFGEDSSDTFHPFRDLFFTKLLGVLGRDDELGRTLQRFRRPHDSLSSSMANLPDSPIYLLYPALSTFLRTRRARTPFVQYQHVAVGERLVWERYFLTIMKIEWQLRGVEDHHFVNLTHQLIKRAQALFNSTDSGYARLESEASDTWRSLRQQQHKSYGDVVFWMEELLQQL